jgi:hypothetical protein
MVIHGHIVGVRLKPPTPDLQGVMLDGDAGAADGHGVLMLMDECCKVLLGVVLDNADVVDEGTARRRDGSLHSIGGHALDHPIDLGHISVGA